MTSHMMDFLTTDNTFTGKCVNEKCSVLVSITYTQS